MLASSILEAAAAGDMCTVCSWRGNIDARASHPDLPAGCTLLMAASSAGQNEVVSWLLERGASINLHAQGGVTALMFATSSGNLETVKLLCAARAWVHAIQLEHGDHCRIGGRRTTSTGHSALQLAEQNGDDAIALILREQGELLRAHAEAITMALLAEEDATATRKKSRGKGDRKKRSEKKAPRERHQHQMQEAATPATDPKEIARRSQGDPKEAGNLILRWLPPAREEAVEAIEETEAEVEEEAVAEAVAEVEDQEQPAGLGALSPLATALTPAETVALSEVVVYSTKRRAAAQNSRRRAAHPSDAFEETMPPPPPPPSTPCAMRRACAPSSSTSPPPSCGGAAAHTDLTASEVASGASSSTALALPGSSTSPAATSAVVSGKAVAAVAVGATVTGGVAEAVAAAMALEEMVAMERRAEAKNRHMQELDERFEMLQLARATSNTSLAALGSCTSLATLDSAADAEVTDELTCVVCMDRPTDATLVHGNSAHVCCCLVCANNLKSLDKSCPMCRKPIETVLRLYFA